jgi:hypothetical protein
MRMVLNGRATTVMTVDGSGRRRHLRHEHHAQVPRNHVLQRADRSRAMKPPSQGRGFSLLPPVCADSSLASAVAGRSPFDTETKRSRERSLARTGGARYH